MDAVTLKCREIPQADALERTVHLVGSLELKMQDDVALLLARRLAMYGVGEGIRHDIAVYRGSSSDDEPIVVTDLDSLAYVFSQDRKMTLYRHCLTFVEQSTGSKIKQTDSKTHHAFAKGIFPFVRPYYYCYLMDNIPERSVDPAKTSDYIEVMLSDAELNCFAESATPVVVNTFAYKFNITLKFQFQFK